MSGNGWLAARMTVVTAILLLWLFLPFFPGGYDHLAVTFSAMAQLVGASAFLFAPIGGAWLMFGRGRGFYFGMAAAAAAAVLAALAATIALVTTGPSLTILVGIVCLYGLTRLIPAVKRLAQSDRVATAPLYLLIVPAVVALAQFLFLGRAVEMSRNLAITNSTPMIDAIEKYHGVHGRYPASLQALHGDYDPGVVGIERYYYQPNGEGYDLYFEQFVNRLGTREIVTYNARGEHLFPSHDSDILEWTPEQLRARRGYYAVHDASRPHWKYFWFD